MFEGLFQPMHLLVLAGCLLPPLLLIVVIVLLLRARARKPIQLAQRSTLEERLQRLAQLREQGLISDEEYQARRQSLLAEV
jgi:uncharacterized membrane protein